MSVCAPPAFYLQVLHGDNREHAPKRVADRVLLGLLPSSEPGWRTVCAPEAPASRFADSHVKALQSGGVDCLLLAPSQAAEALRDEGGWLHVHGNVRARGVREWCVNDNLLSQPPQAPTAPSYATVSSKVAVTNPSAAATQGCQPRHDFRRTLPRGRPVVPGAR